jgi:hypothetical protein
MFALVLIIIGFRWVTRATVSITPTLAFAVLTLFAIL